MPDALRIHLSIDIGPALAMLPPVPGAEPDWQATWDGASFLRDALSRLSDRIAAPVPATWFLRADAGIAEQFGHAAAVFERFADCGAAARGDELGWMPMLPTRPDGSRAIDELATTHALLGAVADPVRSTRMGNLSHDDATIAALDALGIAVDSSAVPGRTRNDGGWRVDWMGTPEDPYHPSMADYRRPGAPAYRLLEVPMQPLSMQMPYDPAPRLRYVDPCFHPRLLWPALSAKLPTLRHLVCLLHPDEMVGGQRDGHPMVAYTPQAFDQTMGRIVDELAAAGRGVSFHRIDAFAVPAAALGSAG
jgi:hypothetical protein